jgi:hypothetical protein
LKRLGEDGIAEVKDELRRLGEEREQLQEQLQEQLEELASRSAPLDRLAEEARKFIETWPGVADLLARATPEEVRVILQHYVEVIELRPSSPGGRAGVYALRLFPEAAGGPSGSGNPEEDDQAGGPPARVPQSRRGDRR